ncbi:MAG: hypothetical protein A2X12_00440 [Bacteroidetes bacterium GWE2_29_8]|nr:MAG: hypothetical protein A2X12_00440 [Bacteroidetes bacterium GWE2_29_8]OFY20758.1 MAG: hypothetical protein A2X02_09705 [Bacteroidetes bacterium GWF2_29_10]
MNTNFFKIDDIMVLNLTDSDLAYENRNKPFEEITINDFNYNVSEAAKAALIFFVDTRKKITLKNLFRISSMHYKRIKRLSV